jgi:hypothetical protein
MFQIDENRLVQVTYKMGFDAGKDFAGDDLKKAEERGDRLASALVEIIQKTRGAPVFTNEGEIFYIATMAMSGGEHR